MLTKKEYEVLSLVALGLCDKEIATILSIAYGTVRNHIDKIILKLNAQNRTHAAIIYKFMNKDWLKDFYNCENNSLKLKNSLNNSLLDNYGKY